MNYTGSDGEMNFFHKLLSRTVSGKVKGNDVSLLFTNGRMLSNNLPKLPVPPLKKTLEKYLRTVKPHLNPDEFRNTTEIVKNFGAPGGSGEKLQKMLEDRAAKKENWLSEWWLDNAYLGYRLPLVVYSSPGLVFPLRNFRKESVMEEQIEFAAKIILGALDFKKLIDGNQLEPDKLGESYLDMSQYYRLFGTIRTPGPNCDELTLNPDSRHIIVAHNNQFCKVDVIHKDGSILTPENLVSALFKAVAITTHVSPPVGILTTQNRNTWSWAYAELIANPDNQLSIEVIKKALFLVCLDKEMPELGAPNRQTVAALQMIHGGGSFGNAGNRWYDKTIQFIVGMTGEVGLTYEHSPAEGPPVATMMDHIMQFINKLGHQGMEPGDTISHLRKDGVELLEFKFNSDVKKAIEIAKRDLDMLVKDLEMTCFTFEDFGKSSLKTLRISPDSFIQVAIQLAFFRIHGEPGAHYESASTRKFKDGRTETIRSCLPEVVTFCSTMLDTKASDKDKYSLLLDAIDCHKRYAIEAVNGEGIDRHLFGLKLLAIKSGMDLPSIFLDHGYVRSSHMRLSTSQVNAKCDSFMCFGPLVPDGYGCCYNPRKTTINFGLSAFNCSPTTHSSQFRESLERSLRDMYTLLFENQKAKL
ncbi:carnitine O-acetyltransferase-like isoform X3 [Artemia franciscana]|uniref:Choline/carnitine acyltransferase domain-containing protein n=1 Tax=Artemia franciscana TaxID=6661 RepID=A0AA88HW94_ARTSF|nr:hypothetical protein QYM36_004909 [Artemia franciscana]